MKLKKAMILFGTVCMLNIMVAGCGSGSESAAKSDGNTEALQENAAGKWQVLEPDVADAVNADFLGKVWKMEEDSFFIAEKEVKILDDGSLSYSSPSSNANLPDSRLIHVVFDDDTCFYEKTTNGNGEGNEVKEAGFQDLKEQMSVEMKGSFQNDEFHATEIRFF